MPFEGDEWVMGHFYREVPEGYADAILLNDPTRLTSEDLQIELKEVWSTIR